MMFTTNHLQRKRHFCFDANPYAIARRGLRRNRNVWPVASSNLSHWQLESTIGNKQLEATALANLGIAHSHLDDIHKAINFYEQSLMLSREICDRETEGLTLTKLAEANAQLGDDNRAVDYYGQALSLHREVGNLYGEAHVLASYAVTKYDSGDRMEAIAASEKSLKILEAIENSTASVVRENLAKWRK